MAEKTYWINHAFASELPAEGDQPAYVHYFTRETAYLIPKLPAARIAELLAANLIVEEEVVILTDTAQPVATVSTKTTAKSA